MVRDSACVSTVWRGRLTARLCKGELGRCTRDDAMPEAIRGCCGVSAPHAASDSVPLPACDQEQYLGMPLSVGATGPVGIKHLSTLSYFFSALCTRCSNFLPPHPALSVFKKTNHISVSPRRFSFRSHFLVLNLMQVLFTWQVAVLRRDEICNQACSSFTFTFIQRKSEIARELKHLIRKKVEVSKMHWLPPSNGRTG